MLRYCFRCRVPASKSISYEIKGTRGTSDTAAVEIQDTMEPDGAGKVTFALPSTFCGTITVLAWTATNSKP